ncbi:alpha/beta fold hydrolase [Glycomyces buryatensis]|uniref:Alpha/beta hydrolase n=1 Tax=Glycomyces buryatensis TaxID=2570927 RepID=A0A4S8QB31_9ACTN|nr:alpha/beta hydrolase [Glycomyces buryatensis]THV41687.1 alpha/beta hydrolase [Glycomyces buryatensis]
MTEPRTHMLEAPGAVLHYDVREGGTGDGPVLLLIGSPMAAPGFTTLAGHFTDRTVVTYDPRGSERSVRTDGAAETTPDEHADDLHRLIAALGTGPVDLFASSGGAVNALALVAQHPEQVRTLVAHEPPASAELPDAKELLAVCEDIRATYLSSGFEPAMVKFIALVSLQGPVTAEYLNGPGPSPADFGLPTEDDGSRDDPLLGQNLVTCGPYRHNFEALRAAQTSIVIAVGADSGEEMAARAARAVAARLGTEPVEFPDGHGGFLGGEYGQTGKPEAFAAALRQTIDD